MNLPVRVCVELRKLPPGGSFLLRTGKLPVARSSPVGAQRTGLIGQVYDGICGEARLERSTRSFDVKQSSHQHHGSERQHEHRACELVNFTIHPSSPRRNCES